MGKKITKQSESNDVDECGNNGNTNDNSNDGDDNQRIDSSDHSRGENNKCDENKTKDVPIESNDDNEIDEINDNNNGMDGDDIMELMMTIISKQQLVSNKTDSKKQKVDDNSTEDTAEDDEADRPMPTQNAGHFLKGNPAWNKGKARSEETKVSFISFSHFHAL